MNFQLIASGRFFDVDRFLAETTFHCDRKFRRGENHHYSSGFSRVLGKATKLTFEQQVEVAVGFIAEYKDDLCRLMMWPGVTEVEILLTPEVELAPYIVGIRSYTIPPSLMQACAALGLVVGVAVRVKWPDGFELVRRESETS